MLMLTSNTYFYYCSNLLCAMNYIAIYHVSNFILCHRANLLNYSTFSASVIPNIT